LVQRRVQQALFLRGEIAFRLALEHVEHVDMMLGQFDVRRDFLSARPRHAAQPNDRLHGDELHEARQIGVRKRRRPLLRRRLGQPFLFGRGLALPIVINMKLLRFVRHVA
jgi:hypothetical protein